MVNMNDVEKGTRLISKSGTKLIYKCMSEEYTWLAVCEIAESREYLIKGEHNYFEPKDLSNRL